MRILILGAQGMAGHMMSLYLKENTDWDIIPWGRKEFEVKDNDKTWKDQIIKLNEAKHIGCIINYIGILKPVANANPILAMKINAVFPHELAELGTALKAKIIHLSTDCWNDLDTYGRSKRAGELNYPNHLTIRTSIIGPELESDGSGLFHWFMSQEGESNGFVNHYWDGVTTLELAKTIKSLIETRPGLAHIKDLRTRVKVNKFELLNYIKSAFKKEIVVRKKETDVIDKTNSNAEIRCDLHLNDQIIELKNWMTEHPNLYQQYKLM